ncbi:hypothetical protein PFICI_07605 [Pestalotiopsis fici W106-1]|uniref:3-hydroxyisobutyrate dehydrogenase n=1 Tax=Pestalotiopsis fici (strain W106-1 / CGMCC3.15140) TaxID=1229662 RepID=W3X4H1_PESFW|nr:uncharacterized protein PFICI_07605 [Pestalotiopsis fici W106-1]ETS80076.1 hypothetical protein PFICI_07605 [Pestalotiopsis fici W106-1]
MGYGMARNVRQKMDPKAKLLINDVDRGICERFVQELSGFGPVKIVDNAKEVATEALTIFSIVPAGEHVRSVYLDDQTGVIAAKYTTPSINNTRRLFIECSTVDITTARLVGKTLRDNDMGTYIDCPVSGGVPAADSGNLSLLLGIDDKDLSGSLSQRLKQATKYFGDPNKIFYCGGLGSGLAAKICNNYLSCTILLANSEAMATGIKLGLDKHVLHRVIQASTGQNFMADNVCPVPGVVEHAPSSHDYKLGFKAQMLAKDVGLGVDAAQSVGIEPSIGKAALEVYKQVALDERCIVSVFYSKTTHHGQLCLPMSLIQDRDASVVYRYLGGPE